MSQRSSNKMQQGCIGSPSSIVKEDQRLEWEIAVFLQFLETWARSMGAACEEMGVSWSIGRKCVKISARTSGGMAYIG